MICVHFLVMDGSMCRQFNDICWHPISLSWSVNEWANVFFLELAIKQLCIFWFCSAHVESVVRHDDKDCARMNSYIGCIVLLYITVFILYIYPSIYVKVFIFRLIFPLGFFCFCFAWGFSHLSWYFQHQFIIMDTFCFFVYLKAYITVRMWTNWNKSVVRLGVVNVLCGTFISAYNATEIWPLCV